MVQIFAAAGDYSLLASMSRPSFMNTMLRKSSSEL